MTTTNQPDHLTPAPAPDTDLDVPCFTAYTHLVSIDRDRNRARFYRLQWQPTLWDERALVCIRGRMGTLGQMSVLHVGHTPQAMADAAQLLRLRLRHGYQLVDWR